MEVEERILWLWIYSKVVKDRYMGLAMWCYNYGGGGKIFHMDICSDSVRSRFYMDMDMEVCDI